MILDMGRRLGRVLACLVFALSGITPAAADTACDARVFTVDSATGHLAETQSCQDGRVWRLGPAVEVDSGDWRPYIKVFGVYDGDAVILYAVTASGELWWRRQEAPGAALGAPVRIAGAMDWRHDVVFAARPGYLAVGDFDRPVRTLRHDGWATGGTTVAEAGVLFTTFHGPAITAVAPQSGYAVGNWDGNQYRVWRLPDDTKHEDVWYSSGRLPTGVRDVTGDGTVLYGVASGDLVLLTQPLRVCPAANHTDWRVSARAAGHFGRVIAPLRAPDAPPSVIPPPPTDPRLALICGGSHEQPWEWQ